jgi:hypothetical protein
VHFRCGVGVRGAWLLGDAVGRPCDWYRDPVFWFTEKGGQANWEDRDLAAEVQGRKQPHSVVARPARRFKTGEVVVRCSNATK